MKKLLLLVVMVSIIFSQETGMQKIKIDRQTQSVLATLFAVKPQAIDLFITQDSIYVVEATYKNKKLVRSLSTNEYQELMTKKTQEIVILEDAKVPYLVGQTILGIGVYSWGLPASLNLTGEKAAATGLLTPFLWAGTAYLIANNANISGGSAFGAFLGGVEGAFHGGFVFNSIRGAMLFSVTENLVDFYYGQQFGFTPGMFQRKFNHCIYGGYYYAVAVILSGKEDELTSDEHNQFASVVSLVEGYASLVLSAKSNYLTYGDALFELRTSILGAQFIPLCLASYDLFREETLDLRIYAGTSLIGFAGGYYLGNRLSVKNDISGPASFLTWLMPYLAHGLTGGLTLIFDKEGNNIARAYPLIFLTTDLGLTYLTYDRFAEKNAGAVSPEKNGFNFYFNPVGLITRDQYLSKLPIVAFSYRF